jgi:Kef-type K+ transport system membrane component KefB
VIPRIAALMVTLAAVVLLRQFTDGPGAERELALVLGFSLIAASLSGEAAERVRLPRMSGYLMFGLLCGPYLLNLITASMARELQVVNGLAIALIALIAGLEINFQRLLPRLRMITIVGLVTMGVMYVGLASLFFVVWPWLPIAPEIDGTARLAIVLVFTAIVVSFSPTVTIAVIAESRARGPLSELVLAIVVLADLVLILAFTLAMQFARTATGGEGGEAGLLVRLVWEIGGSLAFGALLGSVFAVYLRTIGRELTIVLLALCATISAAGQAIHLEPLLAALAAGLVIENVAPVRADALRDAVERGALPVLVIFFAAAGASVHVDALATIGFFAAGVAAVRVAALRGGAALGLRAAGITDPISGMAWMGLVSQAGVTLGLTMLVAAEFPDWGLAIRTLMVAMIALHELAGPVLFTAALRRAGEVGRLDEVTDPQQAEGRVPSVGTP